MAMERNPFASLPSQRMAPVNRLPAEPMAPQRAIDPSMPATYVPRDVLEQFNKASRPLAQPGPPPFGASNLPVPGLSSGYLPSGMNYDYLPQGTMVMAPQGAVSPLQQFIAMGGARPDGPWSPGHPVRVCHLGSRLKQYNGLIGDIVSVSPGVEEHGVSKVVFDIRFPLRATQTWFPQCLQEDQLEHKLIPPSHLAQSAVHHNRRLMFGADDDGNDMTPYLMLTSLTTDKLEPLEASGPQMPGGAMAGTLPSVPQMATMGMNVPSMPMMPQMGMQPASRQLAGDSGNFSSGYGYSSYGGGSAPQPVPTMPAAPGTHWSSMVGPSA